VNEADVVVRTLSAARDALSPPLAEKARVRSALGATPWRSAAPAGSAPSTSPAAERTGAGARVRLGARALTLLAAGVAAAVAASFASGYRLGQQSAAVPPPELPAAHVARAEGSELVPRSPALDAPATGLPARERRAAEAVEPHAPRPRLRVEVAAPERLPRRDAQPDELALLRRVERALRNAEPALALGLLAELDERFPNSALDEERRASNAMAHCQLHNPGAAERAALFLRDHGASVYVDSVRSSCGVLSAPER
jgi:hypothetical protein